MYCQEPDPLISISVYTKKLLRAEKNKNKVSPPHPLRNLVEFIEMRSTQKYPKAYVLFI